MSYLPFYFSFFFCMIQVILYMELYVSTSALLLFVIATEYKHNLREYLSGFNIFILLLKYQLLDLSMN